RVPSGDSPQTTSSSTDAVTSLRPSAAKRVTIRMVPTTPMPIRKLVGNSRAPSVLERIKNKYGPHTDERLRQASCSVSYAGLTRVSIYLQKEDYSEVMDCRAEASGSDAVLQTAMPGN